MTSSTCRGIGPLNGVRDFAFTASTSPAKYATESSLSEPAEALSVDGRMRERRRRRPASRRAPSDSTWSSPEARHLHQRHDIRVSGPSAVMTCPPYSVTGNHDWTVSRTST